MQNHPSPIWQLQEAKAKLSQLVKQATLSGPQFISVHGEKAVVILSVQDFNLLVQPNDNFWQFMQKSPLKGISLSLKRNKDTTRDIDL
jgi:antitoxin Phd